jgi:putative nucleotidyltransferase with HDIG domain
VSTAIGRIGTDAHTWRDRERGLLTPQVYPACVIAAGLFALAAAAHGMAAAPPDLRFVVFAALTIVSGQVMLRMPEIPVSFSISDIFTFATALMFGPGPGAVVAAIDAAVMSTRLVRSQRSLTRYLFNVSAAALAMAVAARIFFALSHTSPLADDPAIIIAHVGSLAAFAAAYFFLNTGLVATAVALAGKQSPFHVWRAHFVTLWPGYAGGASAAGLGLFLVSTQNGDLRPLAFVLPIPFILYITFRTAVARMHDDVAHLTRINSIYLSTIETLAQAVDARDQVTHDHIRRVQKNAMRLAREVGLNEDQQLRALEAAALLHDTGKLAIPEHILNKPDVLTPAEFEVMKRHAVIGADILSSIDFPFPVVPIVRHHHESWDGSGYPDGLRGDEIPMAARILSVVDCFDALTSDRPYRGALTPEKALAVILERRGVMYDPVVVDALLRIKDEISAESSASSRVMSRA